MKVLTQAIAAVVTIILILQMITVIAVIVPRKSATENSGDIRYEAVERFGNIDTDGTLFIAADGNMYAVDAQYPEETGNQFLLRLNEKNTETKADDEVLEVWAAPAKH